MDFELTQIATEIEELKEKLMVLEGIIEKSCPDEYADIKKIGAEIVFKQARFDYKMTNKNPIGL